MKQQVLLTKTKFLCETMEAHEKGFQHLLLWIGYLDSNPSFR